MQRLSNSLAATVLLLGTVANAHANIGTDPVAECHNPQQNIKVDALSNSRIKVASIKVQFNVWRDAVQQTIFVNGNNNGICKITVPDGASIVGKPQWSVSAEDPPASFGKIKVAASTAWQNGNHAATYTVSPGRLGSGTPATITLTMKVNYQFANNRNNSRPGDATR